METLVINAYTRLDQKSKLFETNAIAIGKKELFQRKIYVKKRHVLKISPNRWPFSAQVKTLTEESMGIKISCIKFLYSI